MSEEMLDFIQTSQFGFIFICFVSTFLCSVLPLNNHKASIVCVHYGRQAGEWYRTRWANWNQWIMTCSWQIVKLVCSNCCLHNEKNERTYIFIDISWIAQFYCIFWIISLMFYICPSRPPPWLQPCADFSLFILKQDFICCDIYLLR